MPTLVFIDYMGGTMAPAGLYEDPPLCGREMDDCTSISFQ